MTTTTGETTASETTGVLEPLCPNSDDFSCTVPFTCDDFPCGRLGDLFDADGCPRPHCSDDTPCPAGYVCYDTGDWGMCDASGVACEDLDGQCSCNQTLDCQDIAYCVPAEIAPPDCFDITDYEACEALGCAGNWNITPIAMDGDTCVCGPSRPGCLWWESGEPSGGWQSPGPFYHLGTLEVIMMPVLWFSPPHGWADCENDPNAPPACGCYC